MEPFISDILVLIKIGSDGISPRSRGRAPVMDMLKWKQLTFL